MTNVKPKYIWSSQNSISVLEKFNSRDKFLSLFLNLWNVLSKFTSSIHGIFTFNGAGPGLLLQIIFCLSLLKLYLLGINLMISEFPKDQS